MANITKVCLLFCLLAWTGFQFAYSAELTCATDKQRLDINQLIQKWDADSVVLNDKISTYAEYVGTNTKQTYRLDNERPTGEGLAKFRIQSGSETYGVILVKPNVDFKKSKIRGAFVKSVKECKTEKLEKV